jgi:pyridoxamine-phosphate oxidase
VSDLFTGWRRDYGEQELSPDALASDPMEQFRLWLEEASNAGEIEPNAMGLSTVGPEGRPSSRMVLVKGIDEGLEFFTNYESRKGAELAANPHASGLFWWPKLSRQVRIEGVVDRLSDEESDEYFDSRPLESRLASAASPQSRPVPSREELEAAIDRLRSDGSVSRPRHWGGYLLTPDRFEFWQGRTARLHDRFVYTRGREGWIIQRLAP